MLAQETETDGNKASANRRHPTGKATRANNANVHAITLASVVGGDKYCHGAEEHHLVSED